MGSTQKYNRDYYRALKESQPERLAAYRKKIADKKRANSLIKRGDRERYLKEHAIEIKWRKKEQRRMQRLRAKQRRAEVFWVMVWYLSQHGNVIDQYKNFLIEKKRERWRLKNHFRRARIRETGCHKRIRSGVIGKLKVLQYGKCAVCSDKLKRNFHVDHIMPLALGGQNDSSNVQLLCPSCNIRKSAKHPIDFMQENGFLL